MLQKTQAFLSLRALLPCCDLIQHWNGLINLFQNWVLNHLGIDHLLQLELVERKNAHHLHQTRSQDLALRDFQAHSGLEQRHVWDFSPFELNASVVV